RERKRVSERRKKKSRMAGIVNKIGETLNMGGKKDDERKSDPHGECKGEQIKPGQQGECKGEQIKPGHPGEHKEGITDKIKDKLHGEGGHGKGETKETKKCESD
ncbi:hypothetical protein ACR2V7_25755, partial [Klebsiella pneumoniae]